MHSLASLRENAEKAESDPADQFPYKLIAKQVYYAQ
jgi:hypothetical protein